MINNLLAITFMMYSFYATIIQENMNCLSCREEKSTLYLNHLLKVINLNLNIRVFLPTKNAYSESSV